jgi:LPPG:FO 2-phospho-L-lactate transferase
MSVVALSGGVGGAKMSLGLYRALPADSLTVIVNTGDDFEHLGLRICPDLDTTMYTLAGLEHPEQGWGRRDESWTLMRVIAELGEEPWFRLGDGDVALHVLRTARLNGGALLSQVMRDFTAHLGIAACIVPMTDDRVATRVETDAGDLAFQDYFVRRRCEPRVRVIRFAGAAQATPAAGVVEALSASDLEAIVLCPSNPHLSIDPLLAVPGLREALEARRVPLIAISPLIGGKAVKGPTAKIMRELGFDASVRAIADRYRGLIDGLVVDTRDATEAVDYGMPVFATRILMQTLDDRVSLARFVLDRAAQLRGPGSG